MEITMRSWSSANAWCMSWTARPRRRSSRTPRSRKTRPSWLGSTSGWNASLRGTGLQLPAMRARNRQSKMPRNAQAPTPKKSSVARAMPSTSTCHVGHTPERRTAGNGEAPATCSRGCCRLWGSGLLFGVAVVRHPCVIPAYQAVDDGEGACQHDVGRLLAGFLIVRVHDVVLAGIEREVAIDDPLQLVQRCVERTHDVPLGPFARYVDDDEVTVRLDKLFDLFGIDLDNGVVGVTRGFPCRGGRGTLGGTAPCQTDDKHQEYHCKKYFLHSHLLLS